MSASFSDLVPRRLGGTHGRRREATVVGAAASSVSPATSVLLTGYPSQRSMQIDVPCEPAHSSSPTTTSDIAPSAQLTDVKLCLAFVDFSTLTDFWPPAPLASTGSNNSIPQHAAFTSPVSRKGLLQFMEQNCPTRLETVGEAELPDASRHQPSRLTRLLARENEGGTTPTTVLLVTVLLFALDFLSVLVAGTMFFKLSFSVSLLWMLVPPLTQPVAIVIGPVFMISELPRLGRLFASFNACGIVSILVATCVLMAQQQDDSVVFNLLGLLTVCSIKAALFVSANMHVGNLEASVDLSFMDTPQAHFINNVINNDMPIAHRMSPGNSGFGRGLSEEGPNTNYLAGNGNWHPSSDGFNQPEDSLGNRPRSLSDLGTFRPPRAPSFEDNTQRTSFAMPSQASGHIDVDASPF